MTTVRHTTKKTCYSFFSMSTTLTFFFFFFLDNEILFFLFFSLATLSANPHNNGCLWDNKWCFNANGQCGIYEDEVETKCGQWNLCGGVMCHNSYVHNGKKYCFARDALDSGTHNKDFHAYRKVRGPTANCDKLTSTGSGIHVYKSSGDMGLRSEESKGFGWVEITFPPTKISRIKIEQWDESNNGRNFKLIVRSGTLASWTLGTTVDECNEFCTQHADCTAFTYSEQRGSCKTFPSCPYLTKRKSDGTNYGLGKFDSETFVKGKIFIHFPLTKPLTFDTYSLFFTISF